MDRLSGGLYFFLKKDEQKWFSGSVKYGFCIFKSKTWIFKISDLIVLGFIRV